MHDNEKCPPPPFPKGYRFLAAFLGAPAARTQGSSYPKPARASNAQIQLSATIAMSQAAYSMCPPHYQFMAQGGERPSASTTLHSSPERIKEKSRIEPQARQFVGLGTNRRPVGM